MADTSLAREELWRKLVLEEDKCIEIQAILNLIDRGIKLPTEKEIEREKCLLIYKNGKGSIRYIKPLTQLEYDCLICACAGKNSKDTAKTLAISERSAKKHRNLLIKKTGCKNIYEVTHIAKFLSKKEKCEKISSSKGVQKSPFLSSKVEHATA